MESVRAWDIEEIVKFLDTHGIRVEIEDDKTTLVNTKGKTEYVKAVLPHLRKRKAELVAYYTGGECYRGYEEAPDELAPARTLTQARLIRRAVFLRVRDRAVKVNRKVYGLSETGHSLHLKANVTDEYTHVCVEGEAAWEKLPLIPKQVAES